MHRTLSLLFIFLLLLTISIVHSADPTKNYELLPIWQKSVPFLLPLDVNAQTAGDEIIIISGNQIDVLSNVSLMHQKSFIVPADKAYHIIALPGPTPDSLRLLFGYYTATTAAFDLYLHHDDSISLVKKNCLFFSGYDRDQDGQFHQSLFPIALFKDRYAASHILLSVNSGGDAGTRGMFALDPNTGNIDWQYLTGPFVINPLLIDIDGDGGKEIIFGSYAPENGVMLNGTRDDSCYIFILDDLGHERWRKTIGPYWTGAFPIVGNMSSDGEKKLIVYRYGNNPKFSGYDELIRLDIKNGAEINSQKLGNQFTAMLFPLINLCRDFDGDGIEEFVVGSTDGFVRIYRGDFSLMYTSEPYRRPITVHGVGDLDGDGLLEVACVTADKQLVILNHQLKQLLIDPLPPNFDYLTLIKLPHKYQILLAGQPNDYQLLDFHVIGFRSAVQKQGRNFLILILSLTILVVSLLVLRNQLYGKRAFELLLQILEQTHSLDNVLILDRHQKISRLGKNWANLLQISPHQAEGKNWQEIFSNNRLQPIGEALKKMHAEKLSDHKCLCAMGGDNYIPLQFRAFYISWISTYCFLFFDLSEREYIQQVKHWAQVAQKLAHGIKNPLTTVKLNAEELLHKVRTQDQIQANEVEEFITPIISQVTKLKKMTDGFMRFVEFEQPDLKPFNFNSEIKELILQWQPEKTRKIEIDWELEENLPLAMIDQHQFEYAVKNVFYNALESIRDEGRVLIATRKVQLFTTNVEGTSLANYIELEIRDTGCGIPLEFVDRIKQPYFSYNKPEGTGLGLSIVQKIMDSHGGKFDIQSEVDVGTTVLLRFKSV